MNFFQNQEHARSQTKKLVFFYLMAVLLTAFIIAFLLVAGWNEKIYPKDSVFPEAILLNPMFAYIFVGLIVFILICSAFKIIVLAKGGKYIAEMVGAIMVERTTGDPKLKKYINVVEEMALASGTPVPAIYIMEGELSINAFAAGYDIDDAVVAVSRGAIEHLTRDELQGVVAHEFSHILNGDMKLNIKLMGYLFGLSAFVEIGNMLLRSNRRRSFSSNKKGNGAAGIGLIFYVCGLIGMFFAGLIKAAISRQREFLADASAVQFTRNPHGIGGALKKILGLEAGSLITQPRASEIGHLFFGEAVSHFFSFFATHPPLVDRIKAIDQHLLEGMEIGKEQIAKPIEGHAAISSFGPAVDRVGRITQQGVSTAQQLLEKIPSSVIELAHEKEGAQKLCCAFFLDGNSERRKLQAKFFENRLQLWQEISVLQTQLNALGERYRLPLVDLAIPILKNMVPEERTNFLEDCKNLIQADGKLSSREFILYELFWQSLRSNHTFFDKHVAFHELKQKSACILSFLLLLGKTSQTTLIFESVTKDLYGEPLPVATVTTKTLGEITQAFELMRKAPISFKKKFLIACQQIIEGDKRITVLEYEFLRLVSSILLLPLSPLELTEG
ncbi:MAG: M48 family metalloprotease [Bdellovibrio sp.]|nr:M48 family metalloprotease [Bdellovibrio sp.]